MECLHFTGPGPYFTNTFLLVDGDAAAAVDPACPAETYLNAAAKAGARLAFVLLTHGHSDHTAAVEALRTAGAAVLAFPEDGPLFGTFPDRPLADGEAFALRPGGEEILALHTPGHSPGSGVFLLPGGALLAGDTLFAGSVGRTDFAGGSYETLMASLAKLKAMGPGRLPDTTPVLPGHGPFTTLGREYATNPFLKELP